MSPVSPSIRVLEPDSSDQLKERTALTLPGWPVLIVGAILLAGGLSASGRILYGIWFGHGKGLLLVGSLAAVLLGVASLRGLFTLSPGEVAVLRLAGAYRGTVREPGLWWVHPICRRSVTSIRIRNHETGLLKVNDSEGNPVEIAAAVMWRLGDAARALLAVDDFEGFVRIQTEAAVRQVASGYPYDARGSEAPALRGNSTEINGELVDEIARRVAPAGATVLEARLTRLAYAPEIAQAMLRLQQATAVVAARHRIVEGAVGMVELALDRLSRDAIVELDEERKAAMVSNLLVVLCSDHDPQPVVNAGTLY